MPALTPELATELVENAAALLGEAASLTSGDRGEYIRDGNPENVFDAVPLAMARQGCRRYADNPGNPTAARQARVERACRPYLDSLDYGDGPSLELPFRGGQCPNVFYRIAFSFTNSFGNRQTLEQIARGPLQGTYTEPDGNGNTRAGYIESSATGDPVRQLQTTTNAPFTPNPSLAILFRLDGLPDNCGNRPPEYAPPTPPPGSPGPPREPVTIAPNIDIDIGVEVNPDLTFDIDIGTGPITIDPFGDGDGDGDGGDGNGGDPGDPTDPGTPGDPEGTGSGGDAEGQAPPGTELVGLLVTVAQAPGDANKFANNPKQPFRGIGYVRMGYPNRLGLDISGGTVISPQFFHAQQRGLTNWAVAANTGFDLTIQPYYRDIET